MTAVLGHHSLAVGLGVAAGGVAASLAAWRWRSAAWLRAARWAVALVAGLLSVASLLLVVGLLGSDFSLHYVYQHTDRALPARYRLAAFWAGQEGSILLWAWLVAALGVVALRAWRKRDLAEQSVASAALLAVCGFFLAAMLWADADPFETRFACPQCAGQGAVQVEGADEEPSALQTCPACAGAGKVPPDQPPQDGSGLNPLLQNWAMAIHPPTLFVGYAGFTMPFALLIGALVIRRFDNKFLLTVRRWVLFSWLLLGVGILLGAWWAYIQLGWGGYWAWDPVENASLLPWLTATALIHSLMVQRHRGLLKKSNALLIAGAFLSCIVATYLTRSGVVKSVHAFGQSLVSTLFLWLLLVGLAVSIALVVWRRRTLRPDRPLGDPVSREGALVLAVVLPVVMMAATLIGTIWPIILAGLHAIPGFSEFVEQPAAMVGLKSEVFQWFAKDQVLGQSYYNRVVLPLGLAAAGLMAFGPWLALGRKAAAGRRRWLKLLVLAPAHLAALLCYALGARNSWALAVAVICTLTVTIVLIELARSVRERVAATGENVITAVLRLWDANHRRYGGQLAHLGVALLVGGVAGSGLYSTKHRMELGPDRTERVGGYTLALDSIEEVRRENYVALVATLNVTPPAGDTEQWAPEIRLYAPEKGGDAEARQRRTNAHVAIRSSWLEDLYLVLEGSPAEGAASIQAMINPLVGWLWVGGVVLSLGGLFALLPRIGRRRAGEEGKQE